MKNQYSISEFWSNVYALILTKVFYPKARLIRRPVYIRGGRSMIYEKGLTLGYACRFDMPGTRKTLYIGKNCEFGDNVHIVAHEKVLIGDNCLMASKVFISDTSHGLYDNSDNSSIPSISPKDRTLITKPVLIGNNVWIGENVCILGGVTIGNGSIIGANSVVTKDIPDNTIVAGIPAKVINYWDNDKGKWRKE